MDKGRSVEIISIFIVFMIILSNIYLVMLGSEHCMYYYNEVGWLQWSRLIQSILYVD